MPIGDSASHCVSGNVRAYPRGVRRNMKMLAAVALLVLGITSAHGAITWNLDEDGSWDTTSANWTGDSTTFTDNGNVAVIFNNTAGGIISISPNMSPTSTTVSAAGGTYTFRGGPIDSGSLTKSGSGMLFLAGTNSFSGTITLNQGTIRCFTNYALPAVPLVLNCTSGDTLLDLSGYDATIGSGSGNAIFYAALPDNAVAINTGSGTLTIKGDIGNDSNAYSTKKTINGRLDLGGATRTFSYNADRDWPVVITANISGTNGAGLTVTSGRLVLSGTNTYEGATTVSGTLGLSIGADSVGMPDAITVSPLGTNTLVINGGRFTSDGSTARTILNRVRFSNNGYIGSATRNGLLTFKGTVDLGAATRTITFDSDVKFDGAVTNGGFWKAGTGTLILNSTNNTFANTSGAAAGTLRLGSSNVWPVAATIGVGNGTTDFAGYSVTVGGIFFGAYSGQQLLDTGAATLTLNGNISQDGNAYGTKTIAGILNIGGTNRTFSGNADTYPTTVSAGIMGSGGIIISAGTWKFSGNNTYTGGTTNNNILFWLNTGAQPPSGTTVVNAGKTQVLRVGGAGYFSGTDVAALFNNTMTNVSMNATAIVGVDTTPGDYTITNNLGSSARGLSKYGQNTLTITSNITYTGVTSVKEGTLVLGGNNSAASGGVTFSAGATLSATESNSVPPGTLNLNGGTLRLLNDSPTFFPSPALVQGTGTIFVDRSLGGSGSNNTHRLTKATGAGSTTLTVAGDHGYALTLDTYEAADGNNNYITAQAGLNITTFNPSKMLPLTVYPGVTVTIGVTTNTPREGGMNITGGGTVNFNGPITRANNQNWTVSGGRVNFNNTMKPAGTANLTVDGGAIGGTGTVNVAVTVSGTGGINLQDGAVGTLALGSNLTFSGATGANSLKLDLGAGSAGADKITVVSNTVVNNPGAVVIYLNQIGGGAPPINPGTYTLIEGTGAMDPATDFVLATSEAFGQTYSLGVTGNNLELTVAEGTPGPAAPAWTGGSNNSWTNTGNWVGAAIPTWESNVRFYNIAAANLSTILDKNLYFINSLTYSNTAVSAVTIAKGSGAKLILFAGVTNGNILGNGITVETPVSGSPTHTISADVELATNQTWTVQSGGILKTTGVISDYDAVPRTLTKTGAGLLELNSSGTFVNTYSGGTIVDAGELDLAGNTENSGRIRGSLTINTGATVKGFSSNRQCIWGVDGPVFGVPKSVSTVNINGGTLDNAYNGIQNASFSTITIQGGTISSSGGANSFFHLSIGNGGPGFVTLASSTTSVISASFRNGNGDGNDIGTDITSYPFTVADGAAEVDLLVSGVLADLVPLTKSGSGLMVLTASNLYSGATTINGGTLQLGNGGSAGSINASSGVSVSSGAVLAFNRADNTTFGLAVSGSGNLRQCGAGTLSLGGANTYGGQTSVSNGTLLISGANSLPAGSILSVASGGTFSLAQGTVRTNTVGGLILANGANLKFDWVEDAVDTLTTAASASTTGNVGIVLCPAGIPGGSDLILIHSAGGLTNGGTRYFLTGNTNFTATLTATDTDLKVGNFALVQPLTNAYWYGGQVSGAENALATTDGAVGNWSATQSAYSPTSLVPGAACSAYFSAAGATSQGNLVLGAPMTIKSMTFMDEVNVMLNADGNMLTVGDAAGITVNYGAGAVTLNVPITLGAAQTWSNSSTNLLTIGGTLINGTNLLTVAGEGNTTIAGSIIDGSSGLTKNGSGTLILVPPNTYTGITTISAGVVRIRNATSLGTAAGGTVVTNVGELQIEGSGLGISEPISLVGTGVSGAGALRNLANTNTWTSAITLAGAARIVSDSGLLILTGGVNGSAGGRALTIGGAGEVTVQTVAIGGNIGTLTKVGVGTLKLAVAANAHNGATTINGGVLEISGVGSLSTQNQPFTIAGGGVLRFNTSASHTLSGAITGGGALVQSGGGSTLALNNANNTYSGGTTVSGGRLRIDNGGAYPMGGGSGPLTINAGGTLDMNAANLTVGSLSGTGGVITNSTVSTRTLTIGSGGGSGSFHGAIVGDNTHIIALTKTGSGTNTLGGSNTYYGATVVGGGELVISGTNGWIGNSSGITITNGAVVTISNSAAANSANRLSDTGRVVMAGGTFNFGNDAGASNFTETNGALSIVCGANTIVSSLAAPGYTNLLVFTNLIRTGGTLNFAGTGLGDGTGQNQIMITNQAAGLIGAWATIDSTNMAYYDTTFGVQPAPESTYSNIAYRSDTIYSNDAAYVRIILDSATPGYITLDSATTIVTRLTQSYTQDSTVSNTLMTLRAGHVTIGSGSAALTIGSSSGSGTLTAKDPGGQLVLDNQSATNLVINSVIANYNTASALSKCGTGLVILNAAGNSYSGPTAIDGGTLEIGGSGQLGNGNYSASISIVNGATFKYNSSANQTINMSPASSISGAGSLVKTNSGTLSLSYTDWASTHSGGTVVDAGELELNGGANNNGTTLQGNLTINPGGTVQVNSRCGLGFASNWGGGVNNILINGGMLSGTYDGNTMVATDITMVGGTWSGVQFLLSRTYANPVITTLACANTSVISTRLGPQTWDSQQPTVWTFAVAGGSVPSGVDLLVSGTLDFGTTAPLTKTGAGLMALTGTNAYTGETTISAGTLQLGNETAAGSLSPIGNIVNNGILAFKRTNAITQGAGFGVIISGSGGVSQLGSGTTYLNGANSYSGVTAVNKGTLNVSSLANAGVNSPIGTGVGGASALVINDGVLQYTEGGAQTTDRLFTIGPGGATLDASGGLMTIGSAGGSIAFSSTTNPASLTLTGAGSGKLSAGLPDSGSGTNVTSVAKSGSGTWTLTAINTFSGNTAISGGTLYLNGANSTTNISVASGTTLGGSGSANSASATVAAGGSIEAGCGGSGSLTVGSLDFIGSATTRVSNIMNYTNVPAITVTNNLGLGGGVEAVKIVLGGTAPVGSGAAHLFRYGTISGDDFGGFATNIDTSGMIGLGGGVLSLSNNPPYIDVVWSGADYPVWKGMGTGEWISNGPDDGDWRLASVPATMTHFIADDSPLFDDTAAGTTVVNIVAADVAPAAVIFSNNVKAYTLTGAYGITNGQTGNTPLVKRGTNVLAISTTNKFSGQLSVEAGTLTVGTVNNSGENGPFGNSALPVILGSSGSTGTLSYAGSSASSTKPFTLGVGGGGVFQVEAPGAALTLSAGITGSGDLTKTGAGRLVLAGTNSWGKTAANTGVLQFARPASLYNGATANWTPANITVEGGTTLAFNMGGAGEFTTSDLNTLTNSSHLGVSTATTGLKSGSLIGIDTSSGNYSYGAPFYDVNNKTNILGLVKMGSNVLTITYDFGPNPWAPTYSGGTIVDAGELDINGNAGNNGTPLKGNLVINSNAKLKVNATCGLGYSPNWGGFVTNILINGGTLESGIAGNTILASNVTLAGGTISGLSFNYGSAGGNPHFATLASSNMSVISASLNPGGWDGAATAWPFVVASGSVPSGIDLLVSGSLSGAVPLTKAGDGVMVLSGTNTYTGTTTLNAGTLLVNNTAGSGTGTNTVTCKAGTTLGGSGTIAGKVTIKSGGYLAAGGSNAVGTLTISANNNALVFSGGAVLHMEVDGTDFAKTNDVINLTGANSSIVFGSTATVVVNKIAGATLRDPMSEFVLFQYTGSDPDISGTAWTIDFGNTGWWGGIVTINYAAKQVVLKGVQPPQGTIFVIR